MGFSPDQLIDAAKMFNSTAASSKESIRLSVYLDDTATDFLITTIRDAFVPQQTNALLRVERLSDEIPSVKPGTDVAIVLTGGSDGLAEKVNALAISGVPTVCVAESSLDLPFIERDTPILGGVVASEKTLLLSKLAHWILSRTSKQMAFAASFPFMRIAAAHEIVANATVANMVTGAVFFIPGADFPLMTIKQLGMTLQLSQIFGRDMGLERLYEMGAVAASALALRGCARLILPHTPHIKWLVRPLIAGVGTYVMGRAALAFYQTDFDWSGVTQRLQSLVALYKDKRADQDCALRVYSSEAAAPIAAV